MIEIYHLKRMSRNEAEDIINWKYPSPYNFYDMNEDSLEEMLEERYFSCIESKKLIGFFCFGKSAQVPSGNKNRVYANTDFLDIGLGLHPKLTGTGKGIDFIKAGLEFAKFEFHPVGFRLSVAAFNKTAFLYQ
ncbi:hypothetical protein [Marinilactibacillus kalidii]|uniref:hypothetical protein n=1 Tax=Marinilactibacillus kalidii TaxID=2820274 RepID=UPI001ABEC317|nr:hypothetical protein [Marinilactibacillus kalidii]